MLFDIGGGSTELAWVRAAAPCGTGRPELVGYVSLPVGVVTLAERFADRAGEPGHFQAMMEDVRARLEPFDHIHCIGHEIRRGGVRLLGTSGTVTTLAGLALDLPRYCRSRVDGTVLSREAAAQAVDKLREMGREGLARHPCVGPERAEFVLPGCAIFVAIHGLWPAPEVTVADRGLREGMLLRLIRAERGRRPRAPRLHAPA